MGGRIRIIETSEYLLGGRGPRLSTAAIDCSTHDCVGTCRKSLGTFWKVVLRIKDSCNDFETEDTKPVDCNFLMRLLMIN